MYIERVKGSEWYVSVGEFSDVVVRDVDGFFSQIRGVSPEVPFQVFDADAVAGWRHLFHAAVNAVAAFQGGRGISRSLEMECLLYAACRDQISQAVEAVGVSSDTVRIGLLVLSGSSEEAETFSADVSTVIGTPDDSVLEVSSQKLDRLMSVYGVTEAELEAVSGSLEGALTKLVVERGALMALRR